VRVISGDQFRFACRLCCGQFREDLLFRLNTVEIRIPAAAGAPRRYSCLAGHLSCPLCWALPPSHSGLDPAALRTLMQYPGQEMVRELDHTLERAVLMCRSSEIKPADLGLGTTQPAGQNLEELSLEM